MRRYNAVLTDILEDMYKKTGRKHDAYYYENKGALFVPEGYKLLPQNVVRSIGEIELKMMNGDILSFHEAVENMFR